MPKRFDELQGVVNELLAAKFDFNTLPVTSKYRKFKDWIADPKKRERADGSVPASGKKVNIGIVAFGLPATGDANKVSVKIGTRAKTFADGLDGKALLGHNEIAAAFDPLPGFVPAKAILGTKTAGVREASEITGQKYTKSISTSHTIPYGVNGTNTTEFVAQESLLTSATLSAAYSITFTPEKLRRN